MRDNTDITKTSILGGLLMLRMTEANIGEENYDDFKKLEYKTELFINNH